MWISLFFWMTRTTINFFSDPNFKLNNKSACLPWPLCILLTTLRAYRNSTVYRKSGYARCAVWEAVPQFSWNPGRKAIVGQPQLKVKYNKIPKTRLKKFNQHLNGYKNGLVRGEPGKFVMTLRMFVFFNFY